MTAATNTRSCTTTNKKETTTTTTIVSSPPYLPNPCLQLRLRLPQLSLPQITDSHLYPSPTPQHSPLSTANFSFSSSSSCDYSDGGWSLDPDARGGFGHTSSVRWHLQGDLQGMELHQRWKGECDGAGQVEVEATVVRAAAATNGRAGFLQRYRNKNVGFVGDSLNRNMFVSLSSAH